MKRSLLIPRVLLLLMVVLIGVFLRYFAEYFADNTFALSIFWTCVALLIVGTDYLLRKQQKAYKEEKKKEIRYQLLVKGSKDIILEYFIEEDKYVANRGLFTNREEDKQRVIENMTSYIKERGSAMEGALELIEECKVTEENSFYRECQFTYMEDGEKKTLWFQFEGFIVRDAHGKAESAIGKLHDITKWKRAQDKIRKTRLSDAYLDNDLDEKHTVFQLVTEESLNLPEEEFVELLESHKFVGKTLDKLKFATDMDATLRELLGKIGRYLKVDRIAILEFLQEDEEVAINYQWNANPKTELVNYFTTLTKEELAKISKLCDRVGYFEMNPSKDNFYEEYDMGKEFIAKNIASVILGNQLWIPMVSEGRYSGAIFVDKFDTSPYSLMQKVVFSELTGSLTSYLDKIRADDANQSKSVFLSNMSHEIRTPMNAIIGMTEVALRDEMQDDTRKCIEIIQSSAKGLLTVINDILDFSKIESGKVEYVSSKYWVLSLMNDVRSILENENSKKGLNLFFELSDTIPSVLEGDMARIKQVMVNLGNNAIKYTEKGVVVVSLSYKKTGGNLITLCFSVKDTGQGIKEEDLAKLFKCYSQVNKERNRYKEGTGLGLAISKQLIDAMGGVISVESEYGVGSIFSFELPQRVFDWTPSGELSEYHYIEEEEMNTIFYAPKAKILLVDDNQVNRYVVISLLQPTNIIIEEAENGLEAVEKIKENKYDLVLMDHFMPVMNGGESTKIIRKLDGNPNQNVPIIALTANAVSGVKEQLLEAGMNDFISKPIEFPVLCGKLRQWLPKEKCLDGEE